MAFDLLVQLVLHSAVSTLVISGLLLLWGVREPAQRWRYLLLALTLPVLTVVGFRLLDPSWSGAAFRSSQALFNSRPWFELKAAGVSGRMVAWAVLGISFLGLFVQEVKPLFTEARRDRMVRRSPEEFPVLTRALESWEKICPVPGAVIEILDTDEPLSKSKGGRTPKVILSSGFLRRVDEMELVSVLAHEGAHLRKGDQRIGWSLLVLRLLHALDPVGLLLFRKLGEENEKWCDDLAVSATGDRLALASALIHVGRATAVKSSSLLAWGRGGALALGARAREAVITARVERLLKPRVRSSGSRLEPWRLGFTGAVLALLLFHVV